ncbi:hypothetical protein MBLNU13_g02246t2 [Cladosporium sp. NU13]
MVSEKPQKPQGRLVPRLSAAEMQQQIQEQTDENARAMRSSIAALQAGMPFNHIGQGNLQTPEEANGEATTTMQQQLSMTAPTGLNMDWPGFTSQGLGDALYFTTPNLDFDTSAPQNDQEQPMSPFTVTPQDGMPSMSEGQQYGMHGLPFTSGLQNGHVSSMDSTVGGQHSMDSTGWPLLPPYPFQNGGQEALTIDGIHHRFRGLTTMASIETNSHEISHRSIAHNHDPSPYSISRPEGKQDRKQQLDTTRRRPHSYDVPRQAKSLHPTSAERLARASCSSFARTTAPLSDPLLQI